ncbi:nuclease-related domain-containing protein [Apilactobacillus ozensis]|uniref:nuclease-related domain-containing protein n=1 Tax=Apilactobacillus ozensis TaxID=866801 RepID=UPI000704C96F|nr:nuclease-related domain-containing protein [Apilactobacillus ozensis]
MNLAILIYDVIILYEFLRTKVNAHKHKQHQHQQQPSKDYHQHDDSYNADHSNQYYNFNDTFNDDTNLNSNADLKHKLDKLDDLSSKLQFLFINSNSDNKYYDDGVSNEEFIRRQPANVAFLERQVGYDCKNLFENIQTTNNLLSMNGVDRVVDVKRVKKYFIRNLNMVKCDIRNVRKGMDGESRFCDRFNEYIRANNLSKQVVLLQNVKAPYYGNYSDGVTKHNQIDALILTVKGIFIVEIKNYAPRDVNHPMFKVNYAGRICLNNEKPVNANVAHQLIDHEGAVAKLIYELNQQYPNLNLVNNKQEVHRIVIAAHPNIASKSVSSRLGCGNIFSHRYYKINKYDRDVCQDYIKHNKNYDMKYNSIIHPLFNLEAFNTDTFINKFKMFFENNKPTLHESQLTAIANAFVNQTNQIPERRQNHIIIDDNNFWIIDEYIRTLNEITSLMK